MSNGEESLSDSNGEESLSDITARAKQELEDAYTKTFDDTWREKAKAAHGRAETLDYVRRLHLAVLEVRAKELEDIVADMQQSETELRQAVGDVEQAKKAVADIAGYMRAVTKVLGVFEKVLKLVV